MSEPIKAGDLVVVIKPMPCGHGLVGAIFSVHRTGLSAKLGWYCETCGHHVREQEFGAIHPDDSFTAAWRLKRIPPLSELDDVKRDEEITA